MHPLTWLRQSRGFLKLPEPQLPADFPPGNAAGPSLSSGSWAPQEDGRECNVPVNSQSRDMPWDREGEQPHSHSCMAEPPRDCGSPTAPYFHGTRDLTEQDWSHSMTCSKGDCGWLPKPLRLWVPQHHPEQMSISRLWDRLALGPAVSMVLLPAVGSVWSRRHGHCGHTGPVAVLQQCNMRGLVNTTPAQVDGLIQAGIDQLLCCRQSPAVLGFLGPAPHSRGAGNSCPP